MGEAMNLHPPPHMQTIGQVEKPEICVPVLLPIEILIIVNILVCVYRKPTRVTTPYS